MWKESLEFCQLKNSNSYQNIKGEEEEKKKIWSNIRSKLKHSVIYYWSFSFNRFCKRKEKTEITRKIHTSKYNSNIYRIWGEIKKLKINDDFDDIDDDDDNEMFFESSKYIDQFFYRPKILPNIKV